MRQAHLASEVRAAELERIAALPDLTLMKRAAAGVAEAVASLLGRVYGARVVLVVGGGDNGGDALFAGALLARRGAQVQAWLLSESAHAEGTAALRSAGGRAEAFDESAARRHAQAGVGVVVDGVVGTGGRAGLRPDAAAAFAAYGGAPLVAVDVPSGVDVDTGRLPASHVRADVTVTLGTHKVAHLVDPAAEACGVVHLVDLGLDLPACRVEALQADDVRALLPTPGPADHKYTRGVVGVRAGSETYPGAAVLATGGAGCGLAGMVRYVGAAADAVRAAHPEVVVGPGRVQAWVVGSGGGADAEQALRDSRSDDVPLVIDADALTHLGSLARSRRDGRLSVEAVLTPHAGELARMLDVGRDEVEADQLGLVRRASQAYGVVVMLKGRHTLVAEPGGQVRVTTTGTPWLGTAGAGDVLAGLCGALLATGLDPFDAASVGSWLHGAAATAASGGGPIVATDVARALPRVVAGLLG